MSAKILIVDDDPAIRRSLGVELEAAGYATIHARSGSEAEMLIRSEHPDLVLTDLAMPFGDGFQLISAVRAAGDLPILVLSVRGSDTDKIRALDLGADDYVTKPFSVSELLARVRAQLRRRAGRRDRILRFVGLTIDLERRTVQQDEREVKLTPTEFTILTLLASDAGRPVSAAEIMSKIVADAPGASIESVRVHVGSLRRKIEPNPQEPRYFVTEPWVGYRFIAEPLDAL
jgi:two-component system, OmpR family, KDP operon response regulator KdpE